MCRLSAIVCSALFFRLHSLVAPLVDVAQKSCSVSASELPLNVPVRRYPPLRGSLARLAYFV